MIKGSFDFIGINYYNSIFARYESNSTNVFLLDNFDALARTEGKLILTKLYFYHWICKIKRKVYNHIH